MCGSGILTPDGALRGFGAPPLLETGQMEGPRLWFRHRIYKGRGGGRVGGEVCGTNSCKLHP